MRVLVHLCILSFVSHINIVKRKSGCRKNRQSMRCNHRQMTEVSFYLYNVSQQVNRRLFRRVLLGQFVPPRDLFVIDPQNLVRLKHIFTHEGAGKFVTI